MKHLPRKTTLLLWTTVLCASAATAVAEKTTISAVIPWQAQGQVFQTNEGRAQFLGSLEGIMYAENAEGEMDEAFVKCPIVQDINLADGTSSATGKCIIVVSSEDTVYAEIECEGSAGLCRGEFRITGGAGRFAGIRGKGKMTARSPVHALASDLSGGVTIHAAAGILQMPELTVELP
jgi:hypothetical protein